MSLTDPSELVEGILHGNVSQETHEPPSKAVKLFIISTGTGNAYRLFTTLFSLTSV